VLAGQKPKTNYDAMAQQLTENPENGSILLFST
jgi:hypothetical protein